MTPVERIRELITAAETKRDELYDRYELSEYGDEQLEQLLHI